MSHQKTMLTDRFFAAYAFAQIFGVYSIQSPPFFLLYVIANLIVLIFLFLDHKSLLKSADLFVEMRAKSLGEINQNFPVSIVVGLKKKPNLNPKRLVWVAPLVDTLDFTKSSVILRPEKAQEGMVFKADLEAVASQLGFYEIKTTMVRIYSKSGLWVREVSLPVDRCSFRVHPTLKKTGLVKYAEQLARQKLLFQGTRHLTHGRSADQFHSVRTYQFPDEFRHIDQKKTAKYGKLMTRVFDEYHSQHLIIGLDLGRSMIGQIDQSQKYDFYLSASLRLAEEAISHGDNVSFFAFSNKLHKVIPRTRNISAFQPLYQGDRSLCAQEVESQYDLIPRAVAQLSGQRSIVIIFSDLTKPSIQKELVKNLKLISSKNLVIALGLQEKIYFLNDQVLELKSKGIDDENYSHLLYSYWLQNKFNVFTHQASKIGAGAMQFSDDDWMQMTQYVYNQLRDSMRA